MIFSSRGFTLVVFDNLRTSCLIEKDLFYCRCALSQMSELLYWVFISDKLQEVKDVQ